MMDSGKAERLKKFFSATIYYSDTISDELRIQ